MDGWMLTMYGKTAWHVGLLESRRHTRYAVQSSGQVPQRVGGAEWKRSHLRGWFCFGTAVPSTQPKIIRRK